MSKKVWYFIAFLAAILILLALLVQPDVAEPAAAGEALITRLNTQADAQAVDGTAVQAVQRSWLLAQQSGAYSFRTEIEQTTYAAPALTNVGRPAVVEQLSMQGKTDLKAQSLYLTLWQNGASALPAQANSDQALEIRVVKGAAEGRTGSGEWQPIEDVSGSFAPGQNPLAYLSGARDIRETAGESGAGRHFSFQLDGPALADFMRQQLENELRRTGRLPASLNLDVTNLYRSAAGQGELWLSGDGLPQRLDLQIAFPQQTDGSRVKARIQTSFSQFAVIEARTPFGDPLASVVLNSAAPLWLANLAGSLRQVDWLAVWVQSALLALIVLGLFYLVFYGRRSRVYAAFALVIIVSMVFGPLVESGRALAFSQEQAAAQQARDAQQTAQAQQQALTARLAGPAWNPRQDPLAGSEAAAAAEQAAQRALASLPAQSGIYALNASSASAASAASAAGAASPANGAPPDAVPDIDLDGVPDTLEPAACVGKLDCDTDGLTDLQEYRLGISLNNQDSDADGLRDDLEVRGFGSGSGLGASGRWYSNPLSIDSNSDGLPDTLECWQDDTLARINSVFPATVPCNRDSDADGVPDLFAQDNDGDGVDDASDLSPFNRTPASLIYNKNNPLKFNLDGLTADEPLFVDFQLVPTNPDQLSFSRNVLDWPDNDTVGQVQRSLNTTFASGLSAKSFPDSSLNGDMRVVPLVEIKIPAADSSKVLPVTKVLTATRSLAGFQTVKVAEKDEQQLWLQASVDLHAENGSTRLAFTSLKDANGAVISVDRVKIYPQTICPVSPLTVPTDVTASYQKLTTTISGTAWTLPGVALPSIMDGKHILVLEKASGGKVLMGCLQPGDLANGSLPAGEMFDIRKLDSYGVSVRDDFDTQGNLTAVLAYVPANVVSGRTGGEKQAFSVRMPYFMRGGATSLGGAQEIRLIWLVQLLNDDGSLQIIHAYPNEGWRLAGLNARQDLGMRSAVIYQNPDSAVNNSDLNMQRLQNRTWAVAQVMSQRFLHTPVTAPRLKLDSSLRQNLETTYTFPAGSLGIEQTAYQTQDEIARIPTEVTPRALAHFILNNALKPGYTHALLFFAREEDYKAIAWSGQDTSGLHMPAQTSTLASFNWKPFRYVSGKWEAYPISAYNDELKVRLTDSLLAASPADSGIPDYLDPVDHDLILKGTVLADQSYALGMLFGGSRIVATGGITIPSPEEDDSDKDGNIEDIGSHSTTVMKIASSTALDAFGPEDDLPAVTYEPATLTITKAGTIGPLTRQPRQYQLTARLERQKALGSLADGLKAPGELEGKSGKMFENAKNGLTGVRFAAGATSLGLTIAALAGADLGQAGDIAMAVTASLEAAGAVMDLVDAARSAKEAGSWTKSLNSVSRAAKIAAVVGLVLDIGVAAGVFIAKWASGSFGITQLAFSSTLANTIATVYVAVFMYSLALVVPAGTILVMVIGIIDGLIKAICAVAKANGADWEKDTEQTNPTTGGKVSACSGISGYLTEAVTWLIFGQNVLVANMYEKDRLTTSDFELGMVDTNQGFQVGNTALPSIVVANQIKLIPQPSDWKSLLYFWQINWDNLDDATFVYDLVTSEDDTRDVGTAWMESKWQELDPVTKMLTGSHRSPGVQYSDPLIMVPAKAGMAGSDSVKFTQPGINVSIPLYLREAYANPAQECWWLPPVPPVPYMPPICYIRSSKGNNPVDLSLKFDIFPNSLDGFYNASQPSSAGGYTLAWGGETPFPLMKDFDGDGLLSTAANGNDPNDSLWDTDGDRLSDSFELENGTNPRLLDSDGDTLNDRDELIMGADPKRVDTDGDGLTDGQEVFHQGALTWSGGWQYVYDLVNGVPQATWVFSDPTSMDRDSDTLTDYQEKLYGLHPLVVSDPSVLKLNSRIREANAPGLLLRLDERSGAALFSDDSGLANNATCSGSACPTAGLEGKYVNGLVFDGSSDLIQTRESISLTNASFSVAFWASRSLAGSEQSIFSSGSPAAGKGLQIGFLSSNSFSCSFYPSGLTAAVPDSAWHHWACTFNAANRQRSIYRDGSLVAQDTAASAYQGLGGWRLGSAAWGGAYFNGGLDEVGVFPAALSQAQIQAEMQGRYNPGGAQVAVARNDALAYAAILENNLLGKSLNGLLSTDTSPGLTTNNAVAPATFSLTPGGYQTLDGGLSVAATAASGAYSLTLTAGAAVNDPREATNYAALYLPLDGNYQDGSGSQPPLGVTSAGTTPTPEFDWGYLGKAANFSGARTLTLPTSLGAGKDFSFAGWVYWRGGAGSQYPFLFSLNSTLMYLDLNSAGKLRFSLAGQDLLTTSPAVNTWVHLAVTLDSKTKTGLLYVNGTPVSQNLALSASPADYAWSAASLGNTFNGLLDEVYFYNKALTGSQVASLAGPSVNFAFDSAASRLAYAAAPGKSASAKYGSPAYVEGVGKTQGLELNGSTVLEVLNDPTFDVSKGAFTYSFWLKPAGPSSGGAGVRAVFGQPSTGRDWQDTNAGVFLLVKDGAELEFGWGNSDPASNAVRSTNNWNTGWLVGAVQPDAWNQVLITSDGATVSVYVNGVVINKQSYPAGQAPRSKTNLSLGDNNYCGRLDVRNVLTVQEQGSDAGSDSEYVYDFYDEAGTWSRIVYDDNADSGDWEPGDGPAADTFSTLNYIFCGSGAKVNVYEYDSEGSNDGMGPDTVFSFATPQRLGYPATPYGLFADQFSGAGVVNIYYEIHNPVLPFNGSLDDFRLYHRQLSAQEADLLYAALALPYNFSFDDPPGTGLNASLFNFKNEGSIANSQASGFCSPGACPTSGLPGRINQAVLFGVGQSVQVRDFGMNFNNDWPGFGVWVNPAAGSSGQILKVTSLYGGSSITLSRSGSSFCVAASLTPVCSAANYPANQWHYLVLRLVDASPDQALIYINGLIGPVITGSFFNLDDHYNLDAGGGFSGLLDDLRFPFSTKVDTVSIAERMAQAPQVLLHLEETGANQTQFGNPASPSAPAACSGAACPKAGVKGKYGQAARFDGLDDMLSVPASTLPNLTSFSLAVWVKPAVLDRAMNVLTKIGTTGAFDLSIAAGGAPTFARACPTAWKYSDPNNKVPVDQWSHLMVTYDAGSGRLVYYLNGLQQYSVVNNFGVCTNSANIQVGSGGQPFSGSLDEVQIYTRVLKDYEVKALFDIQANWVEEHQSYTILVDADLPASSLAGTLPNPLNYYPNADKQIGASAADPTTSVAMLELGVSRNGGAAVWTAAEACQDAGSPDAGSPAWCPWFKPTSLGGEGSYTLQSRATDMVGQRETPLASYVILVDASAPNLTVDQAAGSKQALTPSLTDANTQVLTLSGSASDPNLSSGQAGSGLDGGVVWVTLHDPQGEVVGDAPYPASVSGGLWTLAYPIRKEQVSGQYSLDVTASDLMANPTSLTRSLLLDGTGPGVELNEGSSGLPTDAASGGFVTKLNPLKGVVSELPRQTGAVAVYHFEETAGADRFVNSAASSGAAPNQAVCSPGACPAAGGAGFLGNGVTFDGLNDSLLVRLEQVITGTTTVSSSISGSFSAAAWVKPGSAASLTVMGSRTPGDFSFAFGLSGGNTIHGQIGDGAQWLASTADAPFAYTANQWVHLAYVVSPFGYTVYANGVEAGTGTFSLRSLPVLADASHILHLGESLGGMLDEVLLYNRELSADEIAVLAARDPNGLQSAAVAFMPLWADEASGAASPYIPSGAPDQIVNLPLESEGGRDGNSAFANLADPESNASCTGQACPKPGGRSPAGSAQVFDGSDDALDLSLKLPVSGRFSVAAWVRPDVFSDTLGVLGSAHGFEINFSGGSTIRAMLGDGTLWLEPNAAAAFSYTAGQWVHVAYVVTETGYAIYLNGQAAGSGALSGPVLLTDSTHPLRLGQSSASGLNGGLSDVQMFARALSAAEVQALFRGRRAVLSLPLDERFEASNSAGASTPLVDASGWNQVVTLSTGLNDLDNKSHAGIVGPAALKLDGLDDGISSAGVAPVLAGAGTSLSYGGWFGPTTGSQHALLGFDKQNGTLSSMLVLKAGSVCYLDAAGTNVCAAGTISLSNWHFVLLTIDPTNHATLYVDNTAAPGFLTTWRPAATDIFKVGYSSDSLKNYNHFNGTVDDVRVYGRALTAEEAADLASAYWHKTDVAGMQADWSLLLPDGMEGAYRLDLRGRDAMGEESYNRQETALTQAIDSQAPRVKLTRQDRTTWANGSGKKYVYTFTAQDQYLTEDGLSTPCGTEGQVARTFRKDDATGGKILVALRIRCSLTRPVVVETANACDVAGNCSLASLALADEPQLLAPGCCL